MQRDSKIYVAGHTGLVGSAIVRRLINDGYTNIITINHEELDLLRQSDVEGFFKTTKPQYVILAAGRVGGIRANMSMPANFIYENLMIQTNVIHSAYLFGAAKLLFLSSACSYPRECSQPMKEESLLSGYLEPTNEPYAVAKVAGIKMCQAYNRQYGVNFICAVPANLYGQNDNFNPEDSHVIPALIMKFHEAKIKRKPAVTVWGTGKPVREVMYVDDLADACLFLMRHYDQEDIINIGVGEEISIQKLMFLVKEVVGYNGGLIFDASNPDGFPRKSLDISKLTKLGWQAETPLKEGLQKTYDWYLKNLTEINTK